MDKGFYIRSTKTGMYWKERNYGVTDDIKKAHIYHACDMYIQWEIDQGNAEIVPVEDAAMVEESKGLFAAFSDGELVVLFHALNISWYALEKSIDEDRRVKPCAIIGKHKRDLWKQVRGECAARGIDPYACTVETTVTVMKPVEEIVTKDIE